MAKFADLPTEIRIQILSIVINDCHIGGYYRFELSEDGGTFLVCWRSPSEVIRCAQDLERGFGHRTHDVVAHIVSSRLQTVEKVVVSLYGLEGDIRTGEDEVRRRAEKRGKEEEERKQEKLEGDPHAYLLSSRKS